MRQGLSLHAPKTQEQSRLFMSNQQAASPPAARQRQRIVHGNGAAWVLQILMPARMIVVASLPGHAAWPQRERPPTATARQAGRASLPPHCGHPPTSATARQTGKASQPPHCGHPPTSATARQAGKASQPPTRSRGLPSKDRQGVLGQRGRAAVGGGRRADAAGRRARGRLPGRHEEKGQRCWRRRDALRSCSTQHSALRD